MKFCVSSAVIASFVNRYVLEVNLYIDKISIKCSVKYDMRSSAKDAGLKLSVTELFSYH